MLPRNPKMGNDICKKKTKQKTKTLFLLDLVTNLRIK